MTSKGHDEEALNGIREQLQVAREQDDKGTMAAVLHSLGSLQMHKRNYEEANAAFEESLQIFTELGEKTNVIANLCQLSVSQRELGKRKEALHYGEKALKMAKDEGSKRGIALAFSHLASIHRDTGDFDKALKHYDEGLKFALEIGSRTDAIEALCNMADISFQQGKYGEAVNQYERGLRLATPLGKPQYFAKIQSDMIKCASAEIHKKHLNEALKQHEQSLKNADMMGSELGLAWAYCHLTSTYISLGRFQEASQHCDEGLRIAKKVADKEIAIAILNERGRLSHELGNYEKALSFNEQARQMADEAGDKVTTAVALLHLGKAQQYLLNFDRAKQLYADSMTEAHEGKDKRQTAIAIVHQMVLAVAMKEYDEAIKLAEKGMAIASQLQGCEQGAAMLKLLGSAHEGLGDYPKAAEAYDRAIRLSSRADSPLEAIAKEDMKRVQSQSTGVHRGTPAQELDVQTQATGAREESIPEVRPAKEALLAGIAMVAVAAEDARSTEGVEAKTRLTEEREKAEAAKLARYANWHVRRIPSEAETEEAKADAETPDASWKIKQGKVVRSTEQSEQPEGEATGSRPPGVPPKPSGQTGGGTPRRQ